MADPGTQPVPPVIPALRDIPQDIAGQALARAVALYHERIQCDGVPPGAFNSSI